MSPRLKTPPTLFLDIDDTLIRRVEDEPLTGPSLLEHRLLALMRDTAARTHGLSVREAEDTIRRLFARKVWWDWHDYLHALRLEPEAFWPEADAYESRWLQPMDLGLMHHLEAVRDAGYRLVITSNNPTSGIRHKLRLAGLDADWQARHIDRVLGTDMVRGMKWHAAFWKRALKLAETAAIDVVCLGDNFLDDVTVPGQAGIHHRVWLDHRPEHMSEPLPRGVMRVTTWPDAVGCLQDHIRARRTSATEA